MVVGAGVAGLAAAAALHGAGLDVVVIERDRLLDPPGPRRGVPQGSQLHNLLGRAQLELEELVPGFLEALRAAGCGEASAADQTHVFELGRVMPRRPLGLRLLCAPRPILEHVLRELVHALDGVRLVDDASASGLLTAGGAVAGVQVDEGGATHEIATDWVVECSGAGSPTKPWWARGGLLPPPVDRLEPDQWYVSARVRRPVDHAADGLFRLVFPTPPASRGGLLSPSGSDWYCSLNGRSVDPVPGDWPSFVDFARSLEDPSIAEALAGAEPPDQLHTFRRVVASWRRFDRATATVSGFLPVGDAVAALNPLFGQGMSVASWQCRELRDLLGAGVLDREATTLEHHRRAAAAASAAWELGRLIDGLVLGTGAPPPATEARRRYARAADRVSEDVDLHRRYVEVWHLLRPVADLMPFLGDATS